MITQLAGSQAGGHFTPTTESSLHRLTFNWQLSSLTYQQLLHVTWLNWTADNSHRQLTRRVESYVTTDGQSASLSWCQAPIWGLRPDFYYCQIVTGLLMWGALSDERTGLSFTIAAGSRQRNHFRIRVPWDSRPYFNISDLRLPFLSPPTTRGATVDVFDPASARDN
jgi:hypothetical protein